MHLWIANCAHCKFGSFCMSDSNVGLRLPYSAVDSWFPALILSRVIVSGAVLYAPAAGSSSSMQIRQLLQSKPRESKAWLLRAGWSAAPAHFQITLTDKTTVMSLRFKTSLLPNKTNRQKRKKKIQRRASFCGCTKCSQVFRGRWVK